MLRVDCYQFYKLATVIHPLTVLDEYITYSDVWLSLFVAKDELDKFFETFPLKTTLGPASNLYQSIRELIPNDLSKLKLNDEHGNNKSIEIEIGQIKAKATEFETVLKAELSNWDAFYVSQKGAFSTAELITQAELMVPSPGRAALTLKAIADFRQAGMCLAFNLGTAAAFHVVRATEEVIRKYYESVVGTLPSVKMRNWGAYHRILTKYPNFDAKVLGWLKHLTEEYRNPVLHPEETLSADDAIEFINACVALISSMARAMETRQTKTLAAQEENP